MKSYRVADSPTLSTEVVVAPVGTEVEACAVEMYPVEEPLLIGSGRGFVNLLDDFHWDYLPGAYLDPDVFGINELYVPPGYYHVMLRAALHMKADTLPSLGATGELAYTVDMTLDSSPQVSYYPRHVVTLVSTDLGSQTLQDSPYSYTEGNELNPIYYVVLSTAVIFFNSSDPEAIIPVKPRIFVKGNVALGYDDVYVGLAGGELSLAKLADVTSVNEPDQG